MSLPPEGKKRSQNGGDRAGRKGRRVPKGEWELKNDKGKQRKQAFSL